MIRRHVGLTQELAGWVADDDRFEIVAPHPLNLLCIALRSRRPRRPRTRRPTR
jgi:aromatic-L-amino-acid/L-tryptophan decarboxylase